MIEPKPKAGVPEKPTEAVDVLGRPLSRGARQNRAARGGGRENESRCATIGSRRAKSLQHVGAGHPLEGRRGLGPKSRMAARRAVRALGAGKAEERLGLGRFASFVERANKSGSASGLAFETERVLGPLLGARAERGDDWARRDRPRLGRRRVPRPEAVACRKP